MDEQGLIGRLTALSHPMRLRIVAALYTGGPMHVSALARHLGISRALLYMHLERLERPGFVVGHLELGEDGKALKVYEVTPFRLELDARAVAEALSTESADTGSADTSKES